MSESLREKAMAYCIENSHEMEKLISMHEEERRCDHSLPLVPTQSWIHKTIFKEKVAIVNLC